MIIDPKKETQKIDSLLEKLLRERGFDHKIIEQKALAAWKNAAGPPIARNTQPVSLINGQLTVYVANSVFINELLFLRGKIIENLNEEVGQPVVKELRLTVKPVERSNRQEIQRSPPLHRPKSERIPLTPEVLERVEQTVVDVEDAELKACLKRLFITQSQWTVIDD